MRIAVGHRPADHAADHAVFAHRTRSAVERKESRGGHARNDYPGTDPNFGRINVVTRLSGETQSVAHEPLPEMPDELKQLLEEAV